MAEVKNPEIMTIRPPKQSSLVVDLMRLAQDDGGRSLNNYVVMVLSAHVKSKKIKLSKIK